jgi:pilus assembly protein CpaE
VLRESFDRAMETAQRRRQAMGIESGHQGPHKRVITVVSPKGGSGKTTVATNLALGLAGLGAGKVAIVDLDLQFGDISTAMRLMPEHSIADAARAGSTLDAMGIKVLLTPHPSGLFALCGPDSPAAGEEVRADTATRAIDLLSEEFQYIVVDTSAGLDEATLAAIEMSTDLVLLCTFDVPSVRSLRKVVQALDQLGMIHQRRHFVLNRADSRVGLATEDVEATVGMAVDVAVSSSRAVPLSMNQGSPLLESDPRSTVARQMLELTQRFTEAQVQQQSSGSRLFRRSAR